MKERNGSSNQSICGLFNNIFQSNFLKLNSQETAEKSQSFLTRLRNYTSTKTFRCIKLAVCVCLITVILADIKIKEPPKKEIIEVEQNLKYALQNNQVKMFHLEATLSALGYKRVLKESMDWDLFWSIKYPFTNDSLSNLKPHQKVNHLIDNGCIASKVQTSLHNEPFQPKSFYLPRDKPQLVSFIKLNPSAMFLEKLNTHRGVVLRDNDYVLNLNSSKTFVQEFIQNPLLIDGYKFDVGVYAIVTSVEPLRVYIYTGEYGFRFCPKKYHPLDKLNSEQYVVADNYLPAWEIPVLRKHFDTYKFGMKDTFDAYVRSNGTDPKTIWDQVEEIIRFNFKQAEEKLFLSQLKYNFESVSNYAEMFRFDFIIDDNFKVFFIEANMSPNLSSNLHPENQYLFKQLIYMYLKLIGMGSALDVHSLRKTGMIEDIASSNKNLVVDADSCLKYECENNCTLEQCKLCFTCMSVREYGVLRRTYIEHMNKMDMKRIVPRPIADIKNFDLAKEVQNMSDINKFLTNWFFHKCKMNPIWCN